MIILLWNVCASDDEVDRFTQFFPYEKRYDPIVRTVYGLRGGEHISDQHKSSFIQVIDYYLSAVNIMSSHYDIVMCVAHRPGSGGAGLHMEPQHRANDGRAAVD